MGLPNDDLPPSYTEATTTTAPTTTTTASPATPSFPFPSSPLTTHLRTLPARLRATQLAHQTAQASLDLDLVDLLLPHVEAFLADLTGAAARAPPRCAELTLVPATPGGVPDGWGLSGAAERRREGEVVRVRRVRVNLGYGSKGGQRGDGEGRGGRVREVRVDDDDDGGAGARASAEAGFDEWGRFDTDGSDAAGNGDDGGWWFRDEDMARRLAAYLRPEPNLERKRVQAIVVERKAAAKEEKSGWGRWGIGGSGRKKATAEQAPPLVPPTPVSPAMSSPASPAEEESVKMSVKAEEVTFRKENEFGVWETRTGWGIVVVVKVKA